MAFRAASVSALRCAPTHRGLSSEVSAVRRSRTFYIGACSAPSCLHRRYEDIRLLTTAVPPPPSPPLPSPSRPLPPASPTAPAPPPPSDSVLDESLHEAQRLVDLSSPSSPPPPSSSVIYASPFLTALRRVKLFSLTSCVLSVLSSPIYVLLAPPTIPVSGRLALTAAVASFSLGTTLALTKMTHPYITRIHLHPPAATHSTTTSAEPVLTLETLNVLARPRYQRVRPEQLRPLFNRLMSNVRAAGVGRGGEDRDFYLHPDLVQHAALQPLAAPLLQQEAEQQGQPQSVDEAEKGPQQGKAE